MAKELAMVQNNDQGKAARDYFLACEERLQAIARQPVRALPSMDPALLQLLTQQQEQIDQLQQTVATLVQQQTPTSSHFAATKAQAEQLRQSTMRQIGVFSVRADLPIREAYTYFYKLLHKRFGVSVFDLSKPVAGSFLDAIDRHGYMTRLAELVAGELALIDPY